MCHIHFSLFLRTGICPAIQHINITLVPDWFINPGQELIGVAQSEELDCDLQWGQENSHVVLCFQVDSDSRPTPMGPPPTSHFHVLSDTPSGLQPINPPKTPQPSAAKTLLDMDKKDPMKKSDSDPGTNFGLKLDQ